MPQGFMSGISGVDLHNVTETRIGIMLMLAELERRRRLAFVSSAGRGLVRHHCRVHRHASEACGPVRMPASARELPVSACTVTGDLALCQRAVAAMHHTVSARRQAVELAGVAAGAVLRHLPRERAAGQRREHALGRRN